MDSSGSNPILQLGFVYLLQVGTALVIFRSIDTKLLFTDLEDVNERNYFSLIAEVAVIWVMDLTAESSDLVLRLDD